MLENLVFKYISSITSITEHIDSTIDGLDGLLVISVPNVVYGSSSGQPSINDTSVGVVGAAVQAVDSQ